MSANSNELRRTGLDSLLARPAVFRGLAATILILAVVSRFLFLEEKAFHHDESLHGYYSHRVAEGNAHEYSALLHGPFLYYFVGAFMFVFGSTDFSARAAAALFGVALVALPLMMKRFWGPAATLSLMALLLVSPNALYFARFLREDVFTSFWVMGTVFGGFLFWRDRKPWSLYFATAMLAFHFVNKENSYLHLFLWALACLAISLFAGRMGGGDAGALPGGPGSNFTKADKRYLVLNAASVFVTIYVLFYSSFFRHSKGPLHGVLDGLYRESLLYWWDQNQKRRIDGPFDYHLPLLANYEFLAIPFLLWAWARVVTVSKAVREGFYNSNRLVLLCVGLALASFVVPRVALVPDACSYTAVCLDTVSKGFSNAVAPLAKLIHVAHTRHVLQILAYVAFGTAAFFSSLALRRRLDAFAWFWLTGAVGVYSYVGEKVPWLTIYVLLPILILAALELGRLACGAALEPDLLLLDPAQKEQERDAIQTKEKAYSRRWRPVALAWIALALPFTLYKGWQAAFVRPDDPAERLVFTQTTPLAKRVRDRWRHIRATNPQAPFKVGMHGDATWPFAWYAEEFDAGDFSKPTPESAKGLDALFLDHSLLEEAKKDFPEFDIYALPLRHWWVPGQAPSLADVASYFFTGKPYPRTGDSAPEDTGVGDSKVLYLEKRSSAFFEGAQPLDFLELLHFSKPK